MLGIIAVTYIIVTLIFGMALDYNLTPENPENRPLIYILALLWLPVVVFFVVSKVIITVVNGLTYPFRRIVDWLLTKN